MGDAGQPTKFQDDPAEIPSAKKWNDNFSFLNFTHENLIRNGDFESLNGSTPSFWTLTGAGASAVSDADSKRGTKAVLVTFGSADASLNQTAVETKFFKGRKVKAWAFVKTSTPNQARIRIADGVGSATSPFHTGGGSYELLEVVLDVAAGATTVDLELHVEIAGSALFDSTVLVDFEEVRGFLENPRDLAGAAKEFFTPAPDPAANVGSYSTQKVASAGLIRITWILPADFLSFISADLMVIPELTVGPQTVELTSNYAKHGEDATATQEQNLTKTYSYTANEMTPLDLLSVLTGLEAGDHVGVLFDRKINGFGDLEVLGIHIKYQ